MTKVFHENVNPVSSSSEESLRASGGGHRPSLRGLSRERQKQEDMVLKAERSWSYKHRLARDGMCV
jgi:hypothetical protein